MTKELGIVRWETEPPEDGIIRWFNLEGDEVAHAKYQVILSYGPGEDYTMGWDVESYKNLGIPFVEKMDGHQSQEGAGLTVALDTAEEIARKIDAEWIYAAGNLVLAISEFKKN